ncbi:hypothetical protein GLOTRDRAFT_91929 [Gloeophyllum trabeum ATCC 11539]|uniref:F-box domain-containing protein n=1 Tax=Gloeophyllum trabeum (strain ATCC 11539 / FP-39264 / Madison 617) TaxID=670483 RepID=S7RYS3_GLOTA|nr:uncharacterized protein GLOTRDRAFT_91929 [Gloeophyllum trabeum ATCC 11539]EPQ58549.1 hypothetical protein GLOTRDRAFT_91929 [Gloeophyllum trabeum ATCC 11539]
MSAAYESRDVCSCRNKESLVQHNELATINRLPEELLCDIFLRTRPDDDAWELPLRVSHVCSHWRLVSLGYPLLWNHVDFDCFGPALISELLSRTRGTTLHVRITDKSLCRHDVPSLRNLWPSTISNACFLSLICPRMALDSDLFNWLVSTPAPRLEWLQIDGSGLWHIQSISPDQFFGGLSPTLQQLDALNLPWALQPGFCKGLSKLNLVSGNNMHSTTHDGFNIIQVLRDCPDIEQLILHGPYDMIGPDMPDISCPVNLRRLRQLTLNLQAHLLLYVLRHIIIPPGSTVRIQSRGFPRFPAALAGIPPHLPSIGHMDGITIRIRSNPSRSDLFARELNISGTTIFGGELGIELDDQYSGSTFQGNIVDSILRTYSFSAVRCLCIEGELAAPLRRMEAEDVESAVKILRHVVNLEELTVRSMSDSCSRLWDALARGCRDRQSPTLPALSVLKLQRCIVTPSLMKFFSAWPSVKNLKVLQIVSCMKQRIIYNGDVIAQIREQLSWLSPGTDIQVVN